MLIICHRCNNRKLLCSGCSKSVVGLGMRLIACNNQDCYKYRKTVPESDGGVRDIICLSCVTEQAAQDDENKGETRQ